MSITTERKAEVINKYKTKDGDTGSPEVQVAIMTERIQNLSNHLQTNKQDLSSRRGLLALVARRRKLLDYVRKIDEQRYKTLIENLGIRR